MGAQRGDTAAGREECPPSLVAVVVVAVVVVVVVAVVVVWVRRFYVEVARGSVCPKLWRNEDTEKKNGIGLQA